MSSTASPQYSEAELEAQAALPSDVFDFFAGGSGDEQTLRESIDAWRVYRFLPRVLRDVSHIDPSTTLLGETVASPIGIAPVGYQGLLHAEGDVAMATGAAAAGAMFTASTRASFTPTDIAAGAPAGPRWFQTYMLRDRALTLALALEAKEAGFTAIVLTADMPVLARRARDVRNGFVLPSSISSEARTGFGQAGSQTQDPTLSFADIAWLRSEVGLPVVVKGVLHPLDAVEALDAGASAIWVSAHGGRQLDGCVTPAYALAPIVEAVNGRAEVYVDGGIRNGSDVLRALALGARAAFVGRPPVWGLAAGGAAGVEKALNELTNELRMTMALTGTTHVGNVSRHLLAC